MSKIFGDEYISEVRKLKKLDKSLLKCKANIERVLYYIENKKSFTGIKVTLIESISTIIKLSVKVETLLDDLDNLDKTFNGMSTWLRTILLKRKSYVIDFHRMSKVRIGAEKLINEYKNILKTLGKQYMEERNVGRK